MRWVEGRIVDIKRWAPGLYSLFVQAPLLSFTPGQFTQIKLANDNVFRNYSFLNIPDEPIIEFYYIVIKSGKLTPKLASLSVGDKIWISHKGSGRFVLSGVPAARILWCFATGTGLGVFLSLLKTKELWEKFKQVVLVHSVRHKIELTHQLLIETWQAQYPKQFIWCPVVTREQTRNAFRDRIPQLLLSKELEETINLSLCAPTSQVMLCGNPSMINEVTQLLEQRGLKLNHLNNPGHITIENYWK